LVPVALAGHDVVIPTGETEPPADTLSVSGRQYRAATWVSNKIVDECSELDRLCAWALTAPEPQSLRWLLVHVFEETARPPRSSRHFGV
jgi:hypothetical protein